MLKIFLVEDEAIIRNSIKRNVNWEQEGYILVGEAADGELAYPMIQELQPDIIITDIKMPFMDGLQLSKLVKQDLPHIKIIILSGYGEFEYAKEAINIGVEEYLLKPVDKNALVTTIKKVESIIEKEKEKESYIHQFNKERRETAILKIQQFYTRIVTETIATAQILAEATELEIDISAKKYNIIRYNLFDKEKNYASYSRESMDIKRIINQKIEEEGILCVLDRIGESTVILLKGTDEQDIQRITNKCIACITQIAGSKTGIEYFVGIGEVVERVSSLPQCYDAASKVYAHSYMGQKNKVVYATDKVDDKLEETLDIENINVDKANKMILEQFIKTGAGEEVKYIVEEYITAIGNQNMTSLLFRQYVTMNVYFYCRGILEEWQVEEEKIRESFSELVKGTTIFTTMESAKEYIYIVLVKVLALRDSLSVNKYKTIIAQAKEYMQLNYAKEDISLQTVAQSVDFSPSHFSTLFSQNTGQTFVEYLTQVRMKKAKELLRCTAMRSSDVGYAVGYKDPHYFSFLFKKTQGYTPKEYRVRRKDCI